MLWQNGPGKDYTTATRLKDIYLIKTGSVDPVVFEFVKRVKEKLRGGSSQFTLSPKAPFLSKKTNSNGTSDKSQVRFFFAWYAVFFVYDFCIIVVFFYV